MTTDAVRLGIDIPTPAEVTSKDEHGEPEIIGVDDFGEVIRAVGFGNRGANIKAEPLERIGFDTVHGTEAVATTALTPSEVQLGVAARR